MSKKLLWVSPFSLHDTSSGAAIQAKTMLQALAKEGVEVIALGSFIFDVPSGAYTIFPKLEEELKEMGTQPCVLEDNGITYHYTTCVNRGMGAFTHDESWRLFLRFSYLCNMFRPDIVMGYGVGTTGVAIQAECKRRGIPFVYSLHNGNHPNYDFNDCALIITDSQATARLYAQRDRLNVQPIGVFIDRDKYLATERKPEYVTLVNPHTTKGVSIFAKLALRAKDQFPDVKFLVVESRGSLAQSLAALHAPDDDKIHPYQPNMFVNVDVAQHTSNMKEIYKMTKILVAPSLWYESWGRVVTEAVLNDIPCIVSSSGGLPEAMGEGGIVVPAPNACVQDHLRIPTDTEIQPWLDALGRLLREDFSTHCRKAAQNHDIKKSTERLMSVLEPLFAKKAGNNPRIIQSGIARMQADGSFK